MKSIRKKLRESRLRTHDAVRAWLKPKVGALGAKCRIAARIHVANSWATRHPKKTFACVVGTLLFALAGNIAFDALHANGHEPEMSAIASMEPLFDGFRTIQANKDVHRQTLMELVAEGQTVKAELDSMVRCPDKSRADSVRIIRHYRKLENIVKSLKTNEP